MSDAIVVEGLPELQAKLEEIGAVKIPNAMRKTIRTGATVMRESIKQSAQGMFTGQSETHPGGLVKGIRFKASRGTNGLAYVIGAFGKGTQHRALVIGGHEIVGHRRAHGLLGGTRSGRRTAPRPFVEQGQQNGNAAALETIATAMKVAISE